MLGHDCLLVSGDDATAFLQAQLTQDIDPAAVGSDPLLAAWCNPKGRTIALFRVRRLDDAWRLALPEAMTAAVRKRLEMFRFRSRVSIDAEPATAGDLGIAGDPTEAEWRARLVADGVPTIASEQSERFTPHMLNLDLLGAVSFDKGCYPGQEVVARTHYRGATKRRMKRFQTTAAVQPGDKLKAGERDAGEVVNAAGSEFLAVVPLDGTDFSVAGHAAQALPLPYALGADQAPD